MNEFASGGDVLTQAAGDIADAVIVTDAETGAIVAVNDAVERVFGYSPAAFRDLDPDEYAADPTAAGDTLAAARRRAAESGASTVRWTARRRDGETFRAESTVSTTTVDGRACFVSVVRDVSDRTEREHELERFAKVLTHDLRSPLNAAEAQVDILRSEAEGGGEWLNRLENVHDRMADIIDDVRALVNGDQHVTDPEPIDLNDAAEDVWGSIASGRADLVVAGDLGTVVADRRRLCRLLENLFDNAVRHGGDGVTVTVSRLDDRDGIAVADDGPGIPDAAKGRLFEYGYTTTSDGTGFGLNIVAAAAAAHGWEVAVDDADAGGARFEITGMDRAGAAAGSSLNG